MKVIKYLGLMFFLSLFLLACQEEPYLELTGPTSIAVNEGVLLTIDSNIEGALEWSSSDSSVLTVEDGIVQGIKAGQATVRVGFSAFSLYQELTITVYSLETAEEIAINQLAQTILASIPNETMQDLNLITYDETSKATITYQSNQEEALTNLGKITRTTDDVRVKLKITIKINDTSGFFEKTVVVRKLTALNLTGDFTLTLGEISVVSASVESSRLVYSSSNPIIFTVDEVGKITALAPGKAVLTVALSDDLSSFVTHEITVVDPLNEIGAYLRDAIPDTIENDVVFLYQHPDYDINVSYQTNSLYIDNEGKVTKDAENRQVTINIHVTLGNRSKTFYKSAVVTMIAVETQLANTRAWFKNLALVSNEEGLLPEVDGVYGRSIFWIGSDPGMIINQHLFPSLEAKTVKLQAFFTIAHRKYLYEYEYISKGVNPMEKLSALKRFMDGYFPSIAGKRLNLPYEEEVIITQSLVYPNTINRMRPGTGLVGKKMPGGVKYIVIHDTGMSGATGTAVGVKDYIHAQANSVTGRVASWHYTIDDKDCFQHVPDDEIAWHAGDGSSAYGSTYFNKEYQAWSIGGGNQNGIGIETCINQGGNYQRTLQRTAKLVASLLIKHHLGLDAIKQHNDFSGKNCPAVIRSSSGRWSEFLKMVEWHLMMNSFDANYSVKTSISNPSAIGKDGIVKQNLINDENVLLSFDITLGSDVLHYEYHVLAKGMTTSEKFSSLYLYLYNNVIPRETKESLLLPLWNEDYQAKLSWESSHPELLSNDGHYTPPKTAKLVSLWVTIEMDGQTETKTFKIYVG